MRILMVTKDSGGEFYTHLPVAEMLKKQGHQVSIVAEGFSMQSWLGAGWKIEGGLPAEGKFDLNTKIRYDLDPEKIISGIKPDVIITGLGDPIHIQESFGLTANRFGVRLGFIEDIWFVHRRSKAEPDFICTIDQYGSDAISSYYADCPKIYITGSPLLDKLSYIKANQDVKSEIVNGEYKGVILIGGQGDFTTSVLLGLSEALQELWNYLVLPKFHPRWVENPEKAKMVEEWEKIILRMEEKNKVLWTPANISPISLIPLAHHVVSVFSNILLETITLGKLSVSWISPETKKAMQESFKINVSSFPLVDMGGAVEVHSPPDYLEKVINMSKEKYERFITNAQEDLRLDFRATERVTQAILQQVSV